MAFFKFPHPDVLFYFDPKEVAAFERSSVLPSIHLCLKGSSEAVAFDYDEPHLADAAFATFCRFMHADDVDLDSVENVSGSPGKKRG